MQQLMRFTGFGMSELMITSEQLPVQRALSCFHSIRSSFMIVPMIGLKDHGAAGYRGLSRSTGYAKFIFKTPHEIFLPEKNDDTRASSSPPDVIDHASQQHNTTNQQIKFVQSTRSVAGQPIWMTRQLQKCEESRVTRENSLQPRGIWTHAHVKHIVHSS